MEEDNNEHLGSSDCSSDDWDSSDDKVIDTECDHCGEMKRRCRTEDPYKMQGFSNPFTTVPTPEQSEAREIAKSEAMTLDEVSKELRDSGVDVDAFLKRCQETIEGCYESALKKSDSCKHRIYEDEDGQAICIECCKYFGWYCQISTKHFCEYEGDEECIHCGAPEERQ